MQVDVTKLLEGARARAHKLNERYQAQKSNCAVMRAQLQEAEEVRDDLASRLDELNYHIAQLQAALPPDGADRAEKSSGKARK